MRKDMGCWPEEKMLSLSVCVCERIFNKIYHQQAKPADAPLAPRWHGPEVGPPRAACGVLDRSAQHELGVGVPGGQIRAH